MLGRLKRLGRALAYALFFGAAWVLNLLILGFIGILIFDGEDGIRDAISYLLVFLMPIVVASLETIALRKCLIQKRAPDCRANVQPISSSLDTRNYASVKTYSQNAGAGTRIITTEDARDEFLRNYRVIGERRTKVVGVTFRNDDGSNRQSILSHCHAGDEITLRYYKYHGAPAYAVHTQYGQIGNLSAELAAELDRYGEDVYVIARILDVTGGYQGLSFGCNIALTFYAPKSI